MVQEKNKLKKMVETKKLNKQVNFINFRSDLKKYYETADLFVCSSKWEGFSNVIAESLGYGLRLYLQIVKVVHLKF